jgi:hypothetical protein
MLHVLRCTVVSQRIDVMGHSRQGGDSGMSAHVRYSLKAEVNSEH